MIRQLFYGVMLFLVLANTACAAPKVNVELQVVDEDNQPVPNANVAMGFLLSHETNRFRGVTDEHGIVKATEEAQFGVSIGVTKEGYYKSSLRRVYGNQNLTMLLREKKTPIAMYAKKINLMVADVGQEYGFDFIAGDFVSPYGNGSNSDMIVSFKRKFTDYDNYKDELITTFPIEYDGFRKAILIKERGVSRFKSDYLAPESGYINGMVFTSARSNNEVYMPHNKNEPLYLRIRSEVKADKIISALYCKIWSGIDLYGAFTKTPGIKFTYHCNPTPNDRNVEFGRNLFKNLKNNEQVREP